MGKKDFLLKYGWVIVLLIVVAGLAIRLLFILTGPINLLTIATEDDAYYYAKLAENIASGKGITYDATTPTAGFHPIFAFIISLGFILFKSELGPIYFMYIVNALLSISSGLILYLIVRKYSRTAGIFSFFFYVFNPYMIYFSLNGMETTVYLFFFLLTIFYYVHFRPSQDYTPKNGLILGALLSLTYLSRADGIFLGAAIFLDQIFILLRKNNYKRFFSDGKHLFLLYCVIGFILLSLSWLSFNMINFGAFQPDSNIAVRVIEYSKNFPDGAITITNYLFQMLKQILSMFFVLVMMSGFGKFYIKAVDGTINIFHVAASVIFLFYVSLLILRNKTIFLHYLKRFKSLSFLMILALFFLYYPVVLLRGAWPRYFAPLLAIIIIIIGIILSLVYDSINKNIGRMLAVIYFFLYILCFLFLLFNLRQPWQSEFYEAARWLESNTPQEAIVGSPDSGIFGYFSHRTIINLDGVMNRQAAIARKEGRIMEYINSRDIDYILDQEFVLKEYDELSGRRLFKEYEEVHRIYHRPNKHDSEESYDVIILKRRED